WSSDVCSSDLLDTTAPKVSVEITTDANNDGHISAGELGGGDITAKVTFGAGTAVGDHVVVTDQTGATVFEGDVTADMLANGQEVTLAKPADGGNATVEATVTDAAGNSDTATDAAALDTTAPKVSVEITSDDDHNAEINARELGGCGITAEVTIGAGTAVGDHVVVTDQTGATVFEGDVTADMLSNGQEDTLAQHSFPTRRSSDLTVTDAAGNSDTATDAAALDTTAPKVSVEIT